MGLDRARRALLALAASLGACQPAPIELDVSGAGDAVIAVALLDAQGAPRRVLPAFGVVDGRLDFGERPQLALGDGEVDVAWARYPRAEMQADFPGAWEARETFAVTAQRPPAEPRAEPTQDGLRWRWAMALPPQVAIEGDALGQVRPNLTLAFEQDVERCRDPARGPQVPFADRLEPLDGVDATPLRSLVAIDAARVVVGGKGIFVLDRGRAFGGVALSPAALMHPNAEVFGLALDPRPEGGARTLYAIAHTAEGGPPRSALIEVRLDAVGLTVVRTATVVPGVLQAVDVSRRGEVVASGDDGTVLLTGPDGADLRRADVEPAPGVPATARALAFTDDPEEPLLVTSTSRLHARLAGAEAWRLYLLNRFRATVVFQGLAPDGAEAWLAGSDNALVHRRGPDEFQQISLSYPPRFGRCADAAAVHPDMDTNRDIVDVVLLGGDPVIAYDGCTGLFRVRREDSCVSVIPLEGGPETRPRDIARIRVVGEEIVAAHGDGPVTVTVRRAP